MDPKSDSPDEYGNDMLEGAAAIAEYLFGSRELRRKVYYLAETSKLPIFRLGGMLRARKSLLSGYIRVQEQRPIRLLQIQAQIAALSGTIQQLEQAGFDTAEARHLMAERRKELKGMSRR
ncbi:hypothetical protein NLM33_46585 [Bradyrhizobium sp. CCGUVB1N3]|uniref:hypothetical protein n=1 Tax=Bradyrhizobium sp. CCGUVB1N3 TaxID=2949629 RepID=UPI0020B44B3A|nr:hypothetical protein [Bradyrhizobium sp. CCGUVB1N3]MCP3477626.1 hypothetical protein [Bradyrhizobium sp. CCGUVB1N3]